MTATEKQIKYAEDIKARIMVELDELGETRGEKAAEAAQIIAWLRGLDAAQNASWWINYRQYDAVTLILTVMRRRELKRQLSDLLAGKTNALEQDHRTLSEFLNLIDRKTVAATSVQRKTIYSAMVKLIEAENKKNTSVAALKHEFHTDYSKHNFSAEWYAEMQAKIAAEEARNIQDYL